MIEKCRVWSGGAKSLWSQCGVGSVDRKNTINCHHQLGLQNRHMHWRGTKNIFIVVVAKVLDLFEDRLAVLMFELVSSVKHGNIH